jgi:hypothetical protein
MNDMSQLPPSAPKGKPASAGTVAPSFDLTKHSEVIETKAFGKVTINDVGVDAFERIAIEAKGDSNLMMRLLLCAAAVGPKGERFTLDALSALPARCFSDRIALLRAAARVNGVGVDDVEKA